MFDVGFLEILVIGIVSLIVIGPERLPSVARTVGTWVGKAQRFVRGVKSDFASELQSGDLKKIIGDQNEQISELRSIVNSARQELKAGVDEATTTTRSSLEDFKSTVAESAGDAPASPSASSGPSNNSTMGNTGGIATNTSGSETSGSVTASSEIHPSDSARSETLTESQPGLSNASQPSEPHADQKGD